MENKVQFGIEEFKDALPVQMKKNVNMNLIDRVNAIIDSDEDKEAFKEDIIGLSTILKDGKFKLENYVCAVKFVRYTMMGRTNTEAYKLTFPEKYAKWIDMGKTNKDISAAVTIYNKGKLVNLVREAAMIPVYVYNADIYQEAINTQVEIMRNTNVSPKVRSDAANSIMSHIKPPEVKKVELDLGVSEDSALTGLRDVTAKLIEQQKKALESGSLSAKEIAEQNFVVIDNDTGEVDK